MFSSLYNLYHKSHFKTPLEDFNTECFAGILDCNPDILQAFVQFLELSGSNYKVETQVYYSESDYPTCFIDMVLKNDDTICFIENKVHSSESGADQLIKYDELLQSFDIKHKELRYITKWSDPKKGFDTNFKQYRWYDIASLLIKTAPDDRIVNDYHEFLKSHNMALKKEITTDTVIALKNFNQAFQTAKLHLDKAYELLQREFPKATIGSQNMTSYKSILEGQRIAYHIHELFQSDKNYHTEILIHFKAEDVSYQVQLWMNSKHNNTGKIEECAKNMDCFDFIDNKEGGLIIHNKVKLYQFIDKDDADGEISKWFESALGNIKQLINSTNKLDWKPELLVLN